MQGVVATQLAENTDLRGTYYKIVVDPTAGISLSSRGFVDTRQVVFDFVLLDDPDAPNFFEFGKRNQLEVPNLCGTVVANVPLRLKTLAQPVLAHRLLVWPGNWAVVEELDGAIHAAKVA